MSEVRANGFFYTDTAATPEEEESMQASRHVPYIVAGGSVPPSFAETVHGYALRHDLPEIRGYYGYDFAEHRFIRLPDADQGVPDQWPSRRLRDIVGSTGKP